MSSYRPPRDCPVCSSQLETTQLGCPHCGTGIVGHFRACDFCGLDDADLEMLRVFLGSRGNMRDLERHLGVSYPTARARFDDLLRRLGLAGPAPASTANGAGNAGTSGDRLSTLRALAEGRLDVDEARTQLGEA
jgi:hypothetical protein